MSKEAINSEEMKAVKELIEKIPPEDLEKAVGGMKEKTWKLLAAAGIISTSILAIKLINKDKAAPASGQSKNTPSSVPEPKKESDFYTPGHFYGKNLKKGFYEYEGKIYNYKDAFDDEGWFLLTEPGHHPVPVAVVSDLVHDLL